MKVNLLKAVMLAVISCVSVVSVAQAATAVFDVTDSLTGTQLQSKTFEFFVPVAGAYEGTLTDLGSPSTFEFLALGVTKNPTVLGGVIGPGTFSFAADMAGTYTAYLFGKPGSDLGSTFGISISAVPEVQTWVMLLVGMGLVAYQLRRRNRGGPALIQA